MNKTQSTAYALHAWLKANPGFNGTVYDMAAALGVHPDYVHLALGWCRHPDTVAVTGWTIPKQPRGNSPHKDWRVFDAADGPVTTEERRSSRESTQRVYDETVNVLGKAIAQLNVLWDKCDHRAPFGRNVSGARRALDGAAALIENAPVPG